MDIISSCILVLLLCTYKCVHLNLPAPEENEAGWHRVHSIPYWPESLLLKKSLRQLMYMTVFLIAPEIGVALAFSQYLGARESLRNAVDICGTDLGLTLSHSFFANMNGFTAVCVPESPEQAEAGKSLRKTRYRSPEMGPSPVELHEYGKFLSVSPLRPGTIKMHVVLYRYLYSENL